MAISCSISSAKKGQDVAFFSAANDTHATSTEDELQLPKSSADQSVGTFPRTYISGNGQWQPPFEPLSIFSTFNV
jgi:secreted protein with Ig-like and vWFA domain